MNVCNTSHESRLKRETSGCEFISAESITSNVVNRRQFLFLTRRLCWFVMQSGNEGRLAKYLELVIRLRVDNDVFMTSVTFCGNEEYPKK